MVLSKGGRRDVDDDDDSDDDDDDDDDEDGIVRSKWISAFARMLELQRLTDPVFHKQQTKKAPATNSNQYPGVLYVLEGGKATDFLKETLMILESFCTLDGRYIFQH